VQVAEARGTASAAAGLHRHPGGERFCPPRCRCNDCSSQFRTLVARPFLNAVQVEGPETRRSELDSLEYAIWTAAGDDPKLWEAGAIAMLGIAVICFGEDQVRTLVLVERFGEAAL